MIKLTNFPCHACHVVTWDKELALVNRRDKTYMFKWEKVANNLPGTSTYDCCWTWVYKERRNGSISADMFVYVHYGQPI